MKKLLLALILFCLPSVVWAQCNGLFAPNTVCGNNTGSQALPFQVPITSFPASAGGLNGQVQYNNSGSLGGLTNTQLTALVQQFNSTTSGAVPASGGGTTNFLRADGTWSSTGAGLPSIAAFDTICNPTSSSAVPIACQSGFLHSKDFGAVGNDSTDDTASLQNWINACSANNLICYLDPPSVGYKITSALTVTSANGITIMGPGRDKVGTGIHLSSTTQNGIVATTLGMINLRGFQITGQSAATAGDMFQLNSGSGSPNQRSTIRDMTFQSGFEQTHFVSASGWTIDNVLFLSPVTNGTSVLIEDTAAADAGDQIIQASTFSGSATGSAIVQTSGGGLKVVGNKIINYANGYVLSLASGIATSDLFFSANSMEAFTNIGINLSKGAGTTFGTVVISGNEVNGCSTCFFTDANTGWLNNLIISNNTFSPLSTGGTCINIGGASYFVVAHNLCQTGGGGSTDGVVIGSGATNGKVDDNLFNNINSPYLISSSSTSVVDHFGIASVSGLPSTIKNGSQIFTNDGSPGSAPCSGGAGGSMAFRQGNVWKCF